MTIRKAALQVLGILVLIPAVALATLWWEHRAGTKAGRAMSTRNYLIVCAAVAAAVCLTVLLVPGVGEAVERALLAFLVTNAR